MNKSHISVDQGLRHFYNVLRTDGMSDNNCAEKLSSILFLRMDEECVLGLEQTIEINLKHAFEGKLV
jgi:hypothetical protein